MTIAENILLAEDIEDLILKKLPIRLGINKKNELIRLIFEICLASDATPQEILEKINIGKLLKEGKSELFHKIKTELFKIRYPGIECNDNPHIMPLKIKGADNECPIWDFNLTPSKIFVEKSVCDKDWTKRFLEKFHDIQTIPIEKLSEGFKLIPQEDSVSLYNSRRKNIFLIENKAAFIKICPCTKNYKRCGYWILNIGFGCPIDCSYCYLQTYSNVPGIILPANIEDYYDYIEEFDKKAKKGTRIGTGEFTDSLAFEKYTEYSKYLIPFFKNTKNLVLELKTKVSDIENILEQEPHDNVVISWSINTPSMARRFEKGAASIDERINAAYLAAKKGYRVGFHFDPLIYYPGWENEYKEVVERMFSRDEIRKKTAWISLGTLRYTPGLKQIAERRFSDNTMYYQGEFIVDTDGKLRYPRKDRIHIYKKMTDWINSFKTPAWVYLCMEPEEVWKEALS
jgi:spore photoproduct lyase